MNIIFVRGAVFEVNRHYRIIRLGETDRVNELPALRQSCFDPAPTDFEIAIAVQPVRVHPATVPGFNDGDVLCGDIERCN
jgi:hypothetical protein